MVAAAQLDHGRQTTSLHREGTFGTYRAQYQAVELPEADVTRVAMWFINGYVNTQTLTLRVLGPVADATFPSGWAPDLSNVIATSEPLHLPGDHGTIPDQEYTFSFSTPVHVAAGVYFLAPQIDSDASVAAYGSIADVAFGKCMRGTTTEIARRACEGNGGDVEDLYYRVFGSSPDAFDYPVGVGDCLDYPLDAYRVSYDMLDPSYSRHSGEDWNRGAGDGDLGDPVCAVGDGVVVQARFFARWGNIVLIEHSFAGGTRRWSQYAHLNSIEPSVAPGVTVSKGQRIGTIGKQGSGACRMDGLHCAHLHFEIRQADVRANNWPRDPAVIRVQYLDPSDRPRDTNVEQGFIEQF